MDFNSVIVFSLSTIFYFQSSRCAVGRQLERPVSVAAGYLCLIGPPGTAPTGGTVLFCRDLAIDPVESLTLTNVYG